MELEGVDLPITVLGAGLMMGLGGREKEEPSDMDGPG